MRGLATVAALAVAAALGGAGAPAAGAAPAPHATLVPAATAPLPPPPAEVRARGRWVVGVRCEVPPFGYLNARGEHAGYEVDIARRFAQLAFGDPARVQFVCVTTPQREPTLNARTVDMILAIFTYTADRATRVDFSLPYYANAGRFTVLRASTVKSVADLAGKSVVTTAGSIYDRWLPRCLPGVQALRVGTVPEMIAALKDGRAQAAAWDESFMLNLIATDPQVRMTQDAFLALPFGIAVRKGEAAMLAWVNAAIRLMTRRDEFYALLRRNVPPVAAGDVPRPGRPALTYSNDPEPFSNCAVITLPPLETSAARPRPQNPRGVARATIRPHPRCPVCGFEATFVFSRLPARGSTVTAVWYYNRQRQGQVGKARARTVRSTIRWAGPAPRGFHWCDLVVKPPGRPSATVARAVVRRR